MLVGDGVEGSVLGVLSVPRSAVLARPLVGLLTTLLLLLVGLVLGLVLLGTGSVDGVTRSSDVLHVRLGLLLQTASSTGSVLGLASGLLLALVGLVLGLFLLLTGLVDGALGGSLLTVGTDDLGVSRVILGVGPELGTVGSLDLELGGLVLADLSTVGSDPLARRGGLVDLVELVLLGPSLVGGLGSGGGKDVTGDETKVVQEFSGFRVGGKEGDQGSEVGGSLVGVGLVLSLGSGHEVRLGLGTSGGVSLSSRPYKVLEQFTVVLLVDHHSGAAGGMNKSRVRNVVHVRRLQSGPDDSRLQDVTDVLYQKLAVGGELAQVDGRHSDGVLERLVDLIVVGHTSVTHGLDDSVELELSGDIGLLLLGVVGRGDAERGGVVAAASEMDWISVIGNVEARRLELTRCQSWSGERATWWRMYVFDGIKCGWKGGRRVS